MKKLFALILCAVSLFVFCAAGTAETADADFLSQIPGTYVELFPELSKEEYHDTWLSIVTPLVGEENAEDAISMLLNMCMGSLYGEEAIAKYTDDPDSMQFNCYFLGGVAKMTIEGNTISGVDANGNEIFRHEYAPIEVENNENGFLFYQSQDAESGQFTYFAFSPDTMADTYHLEFRYAEDTADLMSWFEGAYAYWNVGAIAEDYTEEEITGAITLFGTENLSGEAE